MTIEFQAWPKTPRLFRDIIITEKMDGANAAVVIQELGEDEHLVDDTVIATVLHEGKYYVVGAQSRKRIVTPEDDNYGFAAWVQHNAEDLFDALGPGRHFGEWWGAGIQGRYQYMKSANMRGFSLFNVDRHQDLRLWTREPGGRQVFVEPALVLYRGPFSEKVIRERLEDLKEHGSITSPGDKAEGVCVFHTQSRKVYKYTIDGDDAHKENG